MHSRFSLVYQKYLSSQNTFLGTMLPQYVALSVTLHTFLTFRVSKKMPQSGVGSMQGSNEDCLQIKGHTRGGTHPQCYQLKGHTEGGTHPQCNPTKGHTIFKLRLGALIPRSVGRSVGLSVGLSVGPPKITKKITKLYKTLQNVTKHYKSLK